MEFQVGDWVFLKLRPHRQHSLCLRIHQKLSPRYFGPFRIIQKVGMCAYKLLLPTGSRIHPTFHVSCLKKAIGQFLFEPQLPAVMEQAFDVNFEPHTIMDTRQTRLHGKLVSQVLVQWKNRPPENATWELTEDFQSQFPAFGLEDKPDFEEAGVVTSPNETSPRHEEEVQTTGPIQMERPPIKCLLEEEERKYT